MSQDLFVEGIVAPNDRFRKMYAAYKACIDAGVVMPKDVCDYFDGTEPDQHGMTIELSEEDGVTMLDQDEGYLIDLSKLKDRFTHLKVSLS